MKATNNGEANTMDRQLEAIRRAEEIIEANAASVYDFEDLRAVVVPNSIPVEAVR